MATKPRTLYDKIWDDHVVEHRENEPTLLYIDRHLVHDGGASALQGLREAGRRIRRPDCTLATPDHLVPTTSRTGAFTQDSISHIAAAALQMASKQYSFMHFGLKDRRQGIVHIIGPEQGFTLPGTICVCGDSHTSTHGAFGCLAFGIGSTQVEHVFATQTLLQTKSKNMRITVEGELPMGVTSKDVMLHIISVVGAAGGTGCVIEYAGSVIRGFSMESRMSICNMSIEAGARAGMVAPDQITFDYLRNRPLAPRGEKWDKAEAYWRTLHSDEGAVFDKEVIIDVSDIAPTVTWGTSPQDAVPITGIVPDPAHIADHVKRKSVERSLEYMVLTPNTPMEGIKIDKVFIGSCTNSRIEDLRAAAKVVLAAGPGARVAPGVYAMIVPGSGIVKRHAEAEGLDTIFRHAGFDWREPGCSMCVGMNGEKLSPGERCASTSNRNFEGRQGPGGRTHLLSPPMAVAAALTGRLTDVRKFNIAASTDSSPKLNMISPFEILDDPTPAVEETEDVASLLPPPSPTAADAESSTHNFTTVKGILAPLHIENVDTDMIIPIQFLRSMSRKGLAKGLFHNLRKDPHTGEETDFILNREPYSEAKILVCTGSNFGCGSSREHAAWSLKDFGIRSIIAPSFGDIFYANCFQNFMLPIILPKDKCQELAQDAEEGLEVEVDLEKEEIRRFSPDDTRDAILFTIDPFRKYRLLNGLDDIGSTLEKLDLIEEFERRRSERHPWLDGITYQPSKSDAAKMDW